CIQQISALVRAHRGEHAVMFSQRLAHAHCMEKPRTERRHRRGMEIEVNERARSGTTMLLQKKGEILVTEVMKNPGRDENGCRLVQTKGIGNFKLTIESFDCCESLRLVEQSDIEIDAHQFNILTE